MAQYEKLKREAKCISWMVFQLILDWFSFFKLDLKKAL